MRATTAPAAVVLIRLLVGAVFVSEGVQKFVFSGELGVGRFEKIGIPAPDFFAPFVGVVETLGGALLLLGAVRDTTFYPPPGREASWSSGPGPPGAVSIPSPHVSHSAGWPSAR